jgi:glycosyltransferase involved in cell wall biosynthesis
VLSVIVSCYNEEETIPLFYKEICIVSKAMNYIDFEFIFVDDGSCDRTLDAIKKIYKKDKRIRYLSFSRNFGKEAAMYAGLEESRGDYVTLMDVDLQDPPSMLESMYDLIVNENYDCVGTRRVTRKGEPPIRSFFARQFYKLINKLSDIEMLDGARDYRLMTRQMVDAIINMREYNRYSKGLFSFVGFKTKWLEYENVERVAGETKWNFWKLFIYAIDGITAFSTKPLVMSAVIGFVFCIISFFMILLIIIKTLLYGDPVGGWPSMVCIIFMVSGIQLFCMGIIGQYLSKTYLETKNRPIYILKESSDNIEKIN